jgi:PadR family transcriptional regulator PadR
VPHTPDSIPPAESPQLENLRLELRRGLLVLAVLAQLKAEHYGYTLKRALTAKGLAVEEGTLYPLLRRLESQGLLLSEWRTEGGREKRFYRLSDEGRRTVERLREEWMRLHGSLSRIFEGD